MPGAVNGGGSPGGGLNLVPDEKSKSKSNQGKLRSKMQMRDESDVVLVGSGLGRRVSVLEFRPGA